VSKVPNQTQPEQPEAKTQWRVILRMVLVIYLVTLPACTQNAGHFGPGFFPLLAALLLVPAFALVSSLDAFLVWSEPKGSRSAWLAAIGMTLIAIGYWGIIVRVIYEKSGT
jgi:hypothetical protein